MGKAGRKTDQKAITGLPKASDGRCVGVETVLMERNGQDGEICRRRTDISWLWVKYRSTGVKGDPEISGLGKWVPCGALTNTGNPGTGASSGVKDTASLISDF